MLRLLGWSRRKPIASPNEKELELAVRLKEHVETLSSTIGARSLTSAPENLEIAASYIANCLERMCCQTSKQTFEAEISDIRQKRFSAEGAISFGTSIYQTSNIIGEFVGQCKPEEIVVVGAHYDTIYDCPGADDNASGIAALLEIGRMLSGMRFARTIRLVAFTNEEPPFFRTSQMGSFRYAEECKRRGDKIQGMICLEMLGFYSESERSQEYPHKAFDLLFPKKGNFLALVANLTSIQLLLKAVGAFKDSVDFPYEAAVVPASLKGAGFSDQYAFWKLGYPAIMVTDTAFYRYRHYHELTDTFEKLDYPRFARVVVGLTKIIAELASQTRNSQ